MPSRTQERKLRKSYRLTQEAVALLERMASERGVSSTAVLEQAIRAYGAQWKP